MKTIVSVCSARPNFVKLAAVHHAIVELGRTDINHVIVHTGQHYDPLFSDIFFEQLRIPAPAYNLGVPGGDREQVIEATKQAFARVLPEIRPDIVLVYGDVNGAVGAALAAKEGGYAIGHVESGLRSRDLSMPEEHNRIAVDRIADVLLCSEESGMRNLLEENVNGKTVLVGNTMIDTLIRMLPAVDAAELPDGLPADYAIVTLHRPSNVDDPDMLALNVATLLELASHRELILPMHHRLRQALEKNNLLEGLSEAVHVLPPLGYLPFLKLVSNSSFILTDSGGIQEEATFLRKRCFTLRKNTERPATIQSGSNMLIDLSDADHRKRLIDAAAGTADVQVDVPSIWDGRAGERIIKAIMDVM